MLKNEYKYHYTYRITNTVCKRHYYGSRSTNTLPSLEIGVEYFSSSRDIDFMRDQLENPQHYKYKVIKVFTTSREDAIRLEIKLHDMFDVGKNPNFYNKVKQTSVGFDSTGSKGRKGTRDMKWIHNPDNGESRMIYDHIELPEGWLRGRGNGMRKMVWIHNPATFEETMMNEGSKLPDGYVMGRFSTKTYVNTQTNEIVRVKIGESVPEHFVVYNQSGKLKKIHDPNTFDEQLINCEAEVPDGWMIGGAPRIWITNCETNLSTHIRADFSIPDGWKRGRSGGWKWNQSESESSTKSSLPSDIPYSESGL